jgi:hypothetical protein
MSEPSEAVVIEQISAHWDATHALSIELLLDEPVITGGQEAVAVMLFSSKPSPRPTGRRWDRFCTSFNDEGKNVQLRSFHGF